MAEEPRRILMISDRLQFGGGGSAASEQERIAYEAAGYEVYTFSWSTDNPEKKTARDYVCPESRSWFIRRLCKFLWHPRSRRRLRRVLDEVRPHLVRLFLVSKYPADVYRLLEDYPVIKSLHGPALFCPTGWGCLRKNSADCEMGVGAKCFVRGCASLPAVLLHYSLYLRVSRAAKRNVDLFVGRSCHISESARALGFGPTRFLPVGIDRRFLDVEPAVHEGPPVVLFVGALCEQKGIRYLIDAFSSVLLQYPAARLLIAGRGPLTATLKARAADLSIANRVDFLGFVERQHIVQLYRRAHVLVLPSIWKEQFGLVGPEALACGVPCIGTNVGGIPEWLHDGEWGYTVPPRDPAALAQRICTLLGQRSLRLRFGSIGRKFVLDEYSPDRYRDNFLRLAREFAREPE